MIQSILSNLAIILLMHLCINMIYHYRPVLPKLAGRILVILIGSGAIISMYYLPITYQGFFLDLRLVPLLFFALLRGWKIVLPILLIASAWRLSMGGPGAVPGVLFGMVFPTIVGLCFYYGEKPFYQFKRTLLAASVAWIISDLPTIFYFDMNWDDITKFLFTRYLSVIGASFTLYIFIINTLKQVDLKQRLNYLADYDQLTGLYNKRKFTETIKEKIDNSSHQYFLAILDLDFFKEINDKYGHLTGDKVLIDFGNLLKDKQNENIVFARFGGEEFIAFYKGESLEEAVRFFDGIRKQLLGMEFYSVTGEIVKKITVSIGVSELTTTDLAKQFDETDKFLYDAKNQGRNRVCYCELEKDRKLSV